MRIGLTGGIGSGKSFVCQSLTATFGIPFYDSDSEARRLMVCSPALRQRMEALLGKEVYRPINEPPFYELNKSLVAGYLFSAPSHAKAINAIVHPAVKTDFLAWAAQQEHDMVGLESAILLEAGFRDAVDVVVAVEAPLELRLQRAMQRDSATEEAIRARMARQYSDEERRAQADFVIINDGRDLQPQLSFFIDTLLAQSHQ